MRFWIKGPIILRIKLRIKIWRSFNNPAHIVTHRKNLKIPKGGNRNPYIEKEQTTQWLIENKQKNKQRSTKHTHNG